MQSLYTALDQGGVGLFESPTGEAYSAGMAGGICCRPRQCCSSSPPPPSAGTGKTLSLICGSLQWLQDQRRREALAAQTAAEGANDGASAAGGPAGAAAAPEEDEDAPDWMRSFGEQQERERQRQLTERQAARIARARAKLRPGGPGGGRSGRARPPASRAAAGGDPEAEFLVEDWHSGGSGGDGEGAAGHKRSPGSAGFALGDSGSSSEGGSGGEGAGLGEEEDLELPRKRQVGGRSGRAAWVGCSFVLPAGRPCLPLLRVPLSLRAFSCSHPPCLLLAEAGAAAARRACSIQLSGPVGPLSAQPVPAARGPCTAGHLCEPHPQPAVAVCGRAAPHAVCRRALPGGAGLP